MDNDQPLQSNIRKRRQRSGKVLVMLAILLPSLLGIVGLVFDCGLMMHQHRRLQHSADSAATAAAVDVRLGRSASQVTATANLFATLTEPGITEVTVHTPPQTGRFAGRTGFVEVTTGTTYDSKFMNVLNGTPDHTIRSRSVAGVDEVTSGAAIVILDANPLEVSLPSTNQALATIPQDEVADEIVDNLEINEQLAPLGLGGLLSGVQASLVESLSELVLNAVDDALADVAAELSLPALPTLTAGLEIEGLGRLRVDGAILVNNEWGGVDENGEPVGESAGPPYAVACMPLLPTTRVLARDIRVVGGVDAEDNYRSFEGGQESPLQANRLAVSDPFLELPVPSTASDSANSNEQIHSPNHAVVVSLGPEVLTTPMSVQVLGDVLAPLSPLLRGVVQPLVAPLINNLVEQLLKPEPLSPGVYDSITVISLGQVTFEPGIYIVRGVSPLTQMSVAILGGWVQADRVMFYVTDSNGFSASTGAPDSADEPGASPQNQLLTNKPSVVVAPLLPGSSISGLNDPASPFDGMLIYQRRLDRRPIVLGASKLAGGGDISGTIYSKWGHVIFVGGSGSYDLRFVVGTMRVVTVFTSTIAPSRLLPAARDVLLVE